MEWHFLTALGGDPFACSSICYGSFATRRFYNKDSSGHGVVSDRIAAFPEKHFGLQLVAYAAVIAVTASGLGIHMLSAAVSV